MASEDAGRHSMDEAKRGSIRIEWSNDQRSFVALSHESMIVQFSAPGRLPDKPSFIDEGNQTTDHDLAQLVDRFQKCLSTHGASATMMEMQTLRTLTLTKILGTPAPLKWLSSFLGQWQSVLSSIYGSDDLQLITTNDIEYCRELVGLASGWKVTGDIVRARSTLGKCFEVVRQHLKAPFAGAPPREDDASRELRHVAVTAKKLLLECVAFQLSLNRHKELFARHETPPHVLASLTKDFWILFRQAPLSIEIAILLAHSLMEQRNFALVIRFLDQTTLTGASAELTLVHSRALVYMGFYRQSLRIAEAFATEVVESKEDAIAMKSLRAHCGRLKGLLAQRQKADDFLRLDQFQEADSAYEICLGLVDPADHKHVAVLLLGHANALLGLEQLPEAITDLRKSVQLDPANKLASLRLQTALLQLETERIRIALSGSGTRVKHE